MSGPLHHETVVVEKVAAGGDGIAHASDGRVLFVEGGLPTEHVRVAVHTVKKDFAKGVVDEVLDASPYRVTPPCPALARGCGGCQWQHVSLEGQLALKASIVADALRRTAKIDGAIVREGTSVPQWAYRTSMRFAVDPSGRAGLRAASSHRTVQVDECLVAHPGITALLPDLRVRGADEVSIRVGVASGEVSVLPASPQATVSGLPDHAMVGEGAVVHETVAGVSLRVSAPSFFQSGPDAAELLVAAVRTACGDLDERRTVLDAYGGVGLFAATLPARSAVVVESSRSACADAAVNLPEAEVLCEPFEHWTARPVDLAVVDPARAGLGAAAADVLVAAGPSRIVLVSCDPVSLARDTALLGIRGYQHGGSTVLDLFPNTPHVEVVTVFERR
jgi:23S rRNA (uracil1939-C5)-methyltransferase